jgi:GNAT superfamily N-acetyltransferase
MDLIISGPHLGKSSVCSPILRALPDWFDIEEALLHYEKEIDLLPTFLAASAETLLGFLSIRQHYPQAAEIYVMGIRSASHRQGIGRKLIAAAEVWMKTQGIEYLQVKTMGPSQEDEFYARTRTFYASMGFSPLEELKELWDENPCLLMIKRI